MTNPKEPEEPMDPSAGPDPDYGVTPTDMEALAQRHIETMTKRQRYANLNLRRALEAAPKLTGQE